MHIDQPTKFSDILLIRPVMHKDSRGYFCETFRREALLNAGVDCEFLQENQSMSAEVATVRGLHFQAPPHAQGKLIRVLHGALFDVFVDIRTGSPTYGQVDWVTLSAENAGQLYVPAGYAHGFCTTAPNTEVLYKTTDYYAPGTEGGIRWDDPELNIPWPLGDKQPVLSEKDKAWPTLSELDSPFHLTDIHPLSA